MRSVILSQWRERIGWEWYDRT